VACAEAADVDVRFEVYADMVHVWHLMRDATTDAQRAIDDIGAFVRARTAMSPTSRSTSISPPGPAGHTAKAVAIGDVLT
jgi:hypothetical protein